MSDQMTLRFATEEVVPAGPRGLKKNPVAGAPRLLRTLVAAGLDPEAIPAAAALVAALDENARLERAA